MNSFVVYILSSKTKVLYVGMTNNLNRRLFEHKNKLNEGFKYRYNVVNLVYYEMHSDAIEAIKREKQIKSWSRKKKLELIKAFNPTWKDLSSNWDFGISIS
ncbi:MAG: GIY-YIG nuclease family protein [Chloroherpetonaceae bacterium]|nr:GIY-YIG nuclease family protein [Chloroherpetonaceae bacterium]